MKERGKYIDQNEVVSLLLRMFQRPPTASTMSDSLNTDLEANDSIHRLLECVMYTCAPILK